MTQENYLIEREKLFNRWKKARPEYESNNRRFTIDGIIDYDAWKVAKPKILFLLKENYEEDYEPCHGITVDNKAFSKNIALWRQVLVELYSNPTEKFDINHIKLPDSINDIALVEVKKVNEFFSSSSTNNIVNYAANDKDFIIEQIELINPEIIICCGTYNSYITIYEEKEMEKKGYLWIESSNVDASIWQHNNRLVYNFYHPSYFYKGIEPLFELFYKLIIESNAISFLK